MQVKQIIYSKQYKLGLPNYSNITVGMTMTVEYAEDEVPNHGGVWDQINQQLHSQTDLDPSWIKTEELRDYHKLILKIPKTQ
jgi:hypothetical protein